MDCEHDINLEFDCPYCIEKEAKVSKSKFSTGLDGQTDRIEELEAWIVECRDKILYPLAHENTELGKLAEGFGASTVKLLKKAAQR